MPPRLVITIDTEEDDWGVYCRRDDAKISHLGAIESLQELFDEFSVRPTYLITYPMAMDSRVAESLGRILRSGRCEIGSHCHPWNTPPFEEEPDEHSSMLSNLPPDLQYRKIKTLHDAIRRNFLTTPRSFRCGRWGYNRDVAANLLKLGYRVDSSITAYTDWSMYDGPDFSLVDPRPFRFGPEDVFTEDPSGPLVEVPATVGFLQDDFKRSGRLLRIAKRPVLRRLRLGGLLSRAGLINMVSLSPELSDLESMIELTRLMIKKDYPVVNMFFHSPSLRRGLSPFVRTAGDEKRFFEDIRGYLRFARRQGLLSATLTESAEFVQ